MAVKQSLSINFSQGLETKTDPWQIPIGKFLVLENSIFTVAGQLRKRNGYGYLIPTMKTVSSPAMNTVSTPAANFITTFNGNLTAIGNILQAYSSSNKSMVSKGAIQPVALSVQPTVRSALNQTQCDTVIASNGLMCTVFTEVNNGTADYKYSIQDSVTGQNIVNPTIIPLASGSVTGSPRVFLLAGYFIIAFTNTITATHHLQFIAVSINNPTVVTANDNIVSSYAPTNTLSWDGIVVGNELFVAYNTTSGGQQIQVVSLNSSLSVSSPTSFVGSIATVMSITADTSTTNVILYAAFYDSAGSTGNVVALDTQLNKRMSPTQIISSGTINNITCTVQNGVATVAYEVAGTYSYDGAIVTDLIKSVAVTLPATVTTGTVGTTSVVARSLGLASKSFLYNSKMYMLAAYTSALQPTYFLIDINGNLISRFAYENGGGYLGFGLPQAQVIGSTVNIAYLFKDLIQSTNTSGLTQSIGPAGASNIYSQTGVNLASITFTSSIISVSEIGKNLNLSGGFLWAYDGQIINEQGFHLFPDNIEATWSATGGAIHAQPDGATNTNAYYYQIVYEWTDAQGNIIRSAPSVPISVTTTASGTTGSITVNIPTLRLTYKPDVKIVIYRWSVANQIYYQVTSLTAPTLNNPAVDSIAYVDTLADTSIIGNSIIYTNGGVLENIAGPAFKATTLFDDRLWGIVAEDPNLLWNSRQVIEGAPVEMSDLLTTFVAPTIGAQGSTGDLECIFPMDDKIILSKKNAFYYINGSGPDNTGANSQYSQPIFITSSVGCANQNSMVLIPSGLMFQSDKGIWLLGRDLSTSYIGEAVEAFNQYVVTSATSIPGTTQVRFTLSNGLMLMYDYFYNQWGTFKGAPAVSSTLYGGLHTIIDSNGIIMQETPGIYLDNGNTVNLAFTTGWLSLAGLQGYQRIYEFDLLASYVSPHFLYLAIAYDFGSPIQQTVITPSNFTPVDGSDSLFGQTSPFGGMGQLEQWRVPTDVQKCQVVQLSLREVYDPSYGMPAGAGFTMSNLTAVLGVKKTHRPFKSANTAGPNG